MKKMKKKIIFAALVAALVCGAASCVGTATPSASTTAASETAAATKESEEISVPIASDAEPGEITKAVLDEVPINSAFEKKAESLPDYFDGLDVDALDAFSYYICASGAYPDEIAVFRFNSEDSAKGAVKAVEDRLAYQKETYETYTPDEMYKIDNAVIRQTGNWVYYLVTSDNEKADSIVKGFIG